MQKIGRGFVTLPIFCFLCKDYKKDISAFCLRDLNLAVKSL